MEQVTKPVEGQYDGQETAAGHWMLWNSVILTFVSFISFSLATEQW